MNEMIDALFKSEMIKKVQGETGEAILVLKSRDTTGPSRMVVDFPPLKYCFNRNAIDGPICHPWGAESGLSLSICHRDVDGVLANLPL